jgi:hypothetical protein
MVDQHPDAELAPDVVAGHPTSASRPGRPATSTCGTWRRSRAAALPEPDRRLARAGLDLTASWGTVARPPTVGSVSTDLDGSTSVPGRASGRRAATGVHGNRLASNSCSSASSSPTAPSTAGSTGRGGLGGRRAPERPMLRAPLASCGAACGVMPVRFATESGLARLLGWLDRRQPTNPVLVARAIAWTAAATARAAARRIAATFPGGPAFAHRLLAAGGGPMIAAVLAEDVGAGDRRPAIVPQERTAVADIVIRWPGGLRTGRGGGGVSRARSGDTSGGGRGFAPRSTECPSPLPG